MALAGYLYLVAAALFIVGLSRLASPATARRGNQYAAAGMLLAVIVTLADQEIASYYNIAAGLLVGGGIGAVLARRVQMTGMPQLVATFNGFGGGASALVAAVELLKPNGGSDTGTLVTIGLSALIGSITFSGSLIAFGKLQGILPGRPLGYFGQWVGDGLLALGIVATSVWMVIADGPTLTLWLLVVLSLVLGVTRVLPIGGADMPVVISFLNSLSGVAAAMAGFVIRENALIISGALVGASGLILTNIMVTAMNRTLAHVLFAAFGGADGAGSTALDRTARSASPEDVAIMLAYAQTVVVVPGYGLAVAQAQHAMRDLATALENRGVEVKYGIHPVAGRMPGHMNVLLAEADIPYDHLFDLEQINPELSRTQVALIVGANDVVNPSARDDTDSPLYGMPILEVDAATNVVVIKRSLSFGFAGIDNPLFYLDKTSMLFDDAKQALAATAAAVADL